MTGPLPPSPNPTIRVRPAEPADRDAILDIHLAAFGPSVMNRLLYPAGVTADARAKLAAFLFPATSHADGEPVLAVAELLHPPGPSSTPSPSPAEGVDTGTEAEVVAFARWALHRTERTEAEWRGRLDRTLTAEDVGEGVDVDVFNTYLGGLWRVTGPIMKGDPALKLGTLACNPARGRLGAAAALLRLGNEMADREGLPLWLNATPEGYALYKRFGFEDVAVQDLDVTARWGVVRAEGENWGRQHAVAKAGPPPDGVFRSVLMRREPRAAAP